MYRFAPLIAIFALVLVACGSAATQTATTSVIPTAASTATTTTAAMTASATRDSIYAALPQSVDADGYYVLGNANAPAVMTHYSDLL